MKRRKAILAAVGLVAAVAIGDYWLYPRFAKASGRVENRGKNALWIRYTWAFGEHTPDDAASSQIVFRRMACGTPTFTFAASSPTAH